MTNAINTSVSAQTMSSLEIARLTSKNHQHVLRDIRKILIEAGIDLSKFGQCEKWGNNRTRQVFNLPRLECDLVMSGYSVKYRLAIIRRWHELEAKQTAPRPAALLPKDIAANLQQLTPDNFCHIRYYLMGMVAGQVRFGDEMAVLA